MHGGNGTTAGETAARYQLAHDLRSPIRAIAIYADLMERGVQAPDTKAGELEKYCYGIVAAAEELAGLVDGFAAGPTR